MMNISRPQANAVAAAIHALRDDWDIPGIVKALSDARDRGDAFEVTTAAIYAASDPKNRTPAIIALAGPHWVKGKALGEGGPLRFARCPQVGHTSFPLHNCSACIAERIGQTETQATAAQTTDQAPLVSRERVRAIRESAAA